MPYQDDAPTLSELDGIRYLHFGTEWVQGAMRIARPHALVLDYTEQMMAWLLFTEPQDDDHVGILGLGAASLLKYTLKNTRAQLETVEWNEQVTAICRAYFRLPDSERSVICHQDAAVWVNDIRNRRKFSALMVDLYDAQAQGPVCDSVEFYEGCLRVLTGDGVAVINLFGNHDSFPHNIANIRQAFGNRVLLLPQTKAGNCVVLAFAQKALELSTAALLERAEVVETRYRLPAVRWARALLDQPGREEAAVVTDVQPAHL